MVKAGRIAVYYHEAIFNKSTYEWKFGGKQ
jgi:hypothetical protein